MNQVLSTYCVGKWILYVDADEYLIFPHCDQMKLNNLSDYLLSSNRHSLQCLMIDMYSLTDVSNNVVYAGQDPASVCGFYDKTGYYYRYDEVSNTLWTRGGVRGRIFFEDVWASPVLNKTPFVLWKRHYAYLMSSHQLWPKRLNGGDGNGPDRVTGALLHFKFLADFPKKVTDEVFRQQHTNAHGAYREHIGGGGVFFADAQTANYKDWRSLSEAGLIVGEGWPNKRRSPFRQMQDTPGVSSKHR